MKWIASARAWARRIKHDGVTLWFATKHPDTPWLAKAMAVLVVAYALSPIDLVPDFIPVLGYLDDVILLPVLIVLTVRLLPAHVVQAARAQAQDWMAHNGKRPTSRWGWVLVLLVWLLVAVAAALWLWPYFRT